MALSGACLLALAETAVLFVVVRRHVPADPWWTDWLWPAFGKLGVSYAIVFVPLLFLGALGRWVILRRRVDSRAEPFLAAMLVGTACLLLGCADVRLALPGLERLTAVAWVAAAALGFGTHWFLRNALRRVAPSTLAPHMNVLAGLCLALLIAGAVSFWRSPLFDPGGFRVPRAFRALQTADRPNVVWVVLDAARADRVSPLASDRGATPFLERWSAGTVRFTRCMSNGIWTVPSHASMFTGVTLRQHGMGHEDMWLDDSFETVAEVLQAEGYRTALFSNNPWVSADTNLSQGFEVSYEVNGIGRLLHFSSLEDLCTRWGITPFLPWWDHDFGAAMTNQLIGRWLDHQAAGGAPFFLFVNYMEAHLPYKVPKAYRDLRMTPEQVGRSYQMECRAFGPISKALDWQFNFLDQDFLSEADRETLRRQYEAGLRYLDDRISELMRMLEERGQLGNSLVIITSDHGEYLDTHGMWAHRMLPYNDLLHVGLILRAPGGRRQATVPTPVQLSDLYPTVLNAALGRSHPGPGWGSRDLLALADSLEECRIAVSEYEGPGAFYLRWVQKHGDPILTHRVQRQIAAQDLRFKLMIAADGQRELYDLEADPDESHNLVEDRSEEAERLACFIASWSEQVPSYESPEGSKQPVLTPAVQEALRSLGYIGN